MAELVARPPSVLKVQSLRSEVLITAQTNVSLERCLFKLLTEEKYQIIHMFHMGSVLKITSSWINVLRSTRTLNPLTDRGQVSKLDQFVTVHAA